MWAFSGSILFSAIMAVVFAPGPPLATLANLEKLAAAVSSNQESISELTDAVRSMTTTDEDLRRQLLASANAIISSQNALQQVLSGSSITTVTTSAVAAEAESSNGKAVTSTDGEEKKVTTTINLEGARAPQVQANTSTLREILHELKSLNSHFQEHLSTLSCPPPYVLVGAQCFAFNLEDLAWADARAHCLKLGGDLAEPKDLTQLRLYINTRYPRKGRRNFWLGGVNREKVWQWLSGGPMVEGFWYTNEPSGNGECLAMMDGWEYPLTDFPCENDRRSVCERIIKKKSAR